MTVAIRKIAGTDRDYLADARKFAGRATCFAYFQGRPVGRRRAPQLRT